MEAATSMTGLIIQLTCAQPPLPYVWPDGLILRFRFQTAQNTRLEEFGVNQLPRRSRPRRSELGSGMNLCWNLVHDIDHVGQSEVKVHRMPENKKDIKTDVLECFPEG
jgi:hypothetical protein